MPALHEGLAFRYSFILHYAWDIRSLFSYSDFGAVRLLCLVMLPIGAHSIVAVTRAVVVARSVRVHIAHVVGVGSVRCFSIYPIMILSSFLRP